MPAEGALRPHIGAESSSRQIDGREIDGAIARLAERQHGVVARSQLAELGLGRRGIGHRLRCGRLHPVHRGVFAVGHRVLPSEGRWMAAVLAAGAGAVLSHRSAAALWGMRATASGRIDVTAPRKLRTRPGIQPHLARLAPDEVTVSRNIPVTTPPRTLLDLAAALPPPQLERALNEAEVLRLTDRLSLTDLLARYPAHRGVAGLRRILAANTGGAALTRSELEARFLDFLQSQDLPRPEVNAPIQLATDWIEADCVWRKHRVVVELDGYATHGIRSAFERDRARDRALQAAGWRVVRITWRQLHEEPDAVTSALRTLLTLARLHDVVISTNQFKNGIHVDVDGTVFKIVEFQHVKPGKGGAFVRTKLKRADDGAVIDKTFRAGEKFRPVRTEARKMQFLYADGTDAHFMDSQTYEQLAIPEDSVKESLKWVMPNEVVDVLYVDEQPSDLQVPSAVELAVSETEPGVKGDTASGGGDKPATLESGVVVRVPLFVNVGDRVRVDTRSGAYVSRA